MRIQTLCSGRRPDKRRGYAAGKIRLCCKSPHVIKGVTFNAAIGRILMAYNEQLADRTRQMIGRTHSDVEEKRMFGGLCFMVNGKLCVGVESERMMVRFDPALNDEIMEKNGVGPMDCTGRVMKGYAFVEIEALQTEKELEYWIALALDFNSRAKPSKKKKK